MNTTSLAICRAAFLGALLLAVLAAVWLVTSPTAAQDNSSTTTVTETTDVGTITIRDLTSTEKTEFAPLTAPQVDTTATSYALTDISAQSVGSTVTWSFVNNSGVIAYQIERKMQDGQSNWPGAWQLVEDNWSTTSTKYVDTDGGAGHLIGYRITQVTLTGLGDSLSLVRRMNPLELLWGGPRDTGVSLQMYPHPDGHRDVVLRRYSSPSDTTGTVVSTQKIEGSNGFYNDKVSGIYRYQVEYRKDSDDPDDPEGTLVFAALSNEIIVPASVSALGKPTAVAASGGRLGSVRTITWQPVAADRGAYVVFAVFRKNARNYNEKPDMIGFTAKNSLEDPYAERGEHYTYTVHAVGRPTQYGLNADHFGPESDPITVPQLQVPVCTPYLSTLETAQAYGAYDPPDSPPVNSRYGFHMTLVQTKDGKEVACTGYDLKDWYVLRTPIDVHQVNKEVCDPVHISCDIPADQRGEVIVVDGFWEDSNHKGKDAYYWHDPEEKRPPGRYRYQYRVCSYYSSPQVCTHGLQQAEGPWLFVDTDSVPIVQETPAPVCDPSYPGVCIPPPPPDLNCGDIEHQNFTVVGSDPHNFDSDDDGVGCES